MMTANEKPKQETSEERKAFLLLLAGLELRLVNAIERGAGSVVGRMLLLSDENGLLPTGSIRAAKESIRGYTTGLAIEVNHLVRPEFPKTADLGIDMAGGNLKHHAVRQTAVEVWTEILELGALGVPFVDALRTASKQAAQNVEGIITRASTAGNTMKSVAGEIEAEYVRKFQNKMLSETNTQLNAVFVGTTKAVAESLTGTKLIGFTWRLSAAHPRIDECDDLGGFYPPNDPVLDYCGKVHPSCLCYLEPEFEV